MYKVINPLRYEQDREESEYRQAVIRTIAIYGQDCNGTIHKCPGCGKPFMKHRFWKRDRCRYCAGLKYRTTKSDRAKELTGERSDSVW